MGNRETKKKGGQVGAIYYERTASTRSVQRPGKTNGYYKLTMNLTT